MNQTFLRKLRKLNNFSWENWENRLEEATEAVNLSFNRAISTSPFLMKFGRHPVFNVDLKYKANLKGVCKQDLFFRKEILFDKYAKKHIEKGVKAVGNNYTPGDKVLVFRQLLGDKLGTGWMDGFEVKGRVSKDSWLVYNGCKVLRVHKTHIKKENFREGGVA